VGRKATGNNSDGGKVQQRVRVGGVHDINQAACADEVVSPQLADLVLPANVPVNTWVQEESRRAIS